MHIKETLLYHVEKYPKLEPQDIIKLIFQSEFGGGHIIKDPATSLQRLKEELLITPANPSIELFTPLVGEIVRVNLAALMEHRIRPEDLNEAFVASARLVKGDTESLEQKLGVALALAKSGAFSFWHDSLLECISQWRDMGYPMVSHSQNYRDNYAPAYRVVLKTEIEKYIKAKEK